jgi:hypothetical protein
MDERKSPYYPILIQEHEGFHVVRGDLYPGGLKCCALESLLLEEIPNDELVYAGCYYGHSAYALGIAALLCGKRVKLFMPSPRQDTYIFTKVQSLNNVTCELIKQEHQDAVQEAARDYAFNSGGHLLAIGLDSEDFRRRYITVMRKVARAPAEIWTSAGSGVTARCLQQAFPSARVHVVNLGVRRSPSVGSPASLWSVPEHLAEPARLAPPWPSAPYYDAKIWQVLREHATPGALVWNIA